MSVVRRIWVLVVGVLFVIASVLVEQSVPVFSVGLDPDQSVFAVGYSGFPGTDSLAFVASPWAAIFMVIGIILIVGWVGYQIGLRRAIS